MKDKIIAAMIAFKGYKILAQNVSPCWWPSQTVLLDHTRLVFLALFWLNFVVIECLWLLKELYLSVSILVSQWLQ